MFAVNLPACFPFPSFRGSGAFRHAVRVKRHGKSHKTNKRTTEFLLTFNFIHLCTCIQHTLLSKTDYKQMHKEILNSLCGKLHLLLRQAFLMCSLLYISWYTLGPHKTLKHENKTVIDKNNTKTKLQKETISIITHTHIHTFTCTHP